MFFISYAVEQLGYGKDLVIVNIGKGLSKKAIGVSIADVITGLQLSYGNRSKPTFGLPTGTNSQIPLDSNTKRVEEVNDPDPKTDTASDSAYFNLRRLAGVEPTVRYGIILIVYVEGLIGQQVEERRKIISRKTLKIVITTKELLGKKERGSRFKGYFYQTDVILT